MFPASPLSMAENEEEIPEWGFYVYMAGDNSLYEEVDDDLNEMKMVGSNNDLEIVVLTDQVPQDDSHAYRVIQHGLEETPLQEINASWSNELDMGKGETLRDFMIWATTEYPAEKKILVIWNHGSGWEKVAEDRESHLTVPEIRESIEQYREETGDSKLTMIGFDACLMGMFEIAYELKDQAEMVHGSEAYEPLEGWTYNHLLYKLDKNLTNEELAQNVVYDYVESYRNGSVYTSYSVTAAVIDTTKLESLWNDLENFSSELNSILPIYRDEISNSRDNTQRYDQNPNYRDLYDLTINIENQIPMSDSQNYSEKLQNSINSAIMAEDHWQKPGKLPVDRAHGLTIYFPNEGIKTGYSDLRINQNSWYEFIGNFEMGISSKASFNNLYTSSVDTGTGHNDSVLINGNYNGNASEIKIRLVNSDGKVMNTYDGQVNNGIISNIFLQPTKSGNYSLEIGLYGESGFLEDHYINENLFINLQLPDLVANSPRIMIEDEKGDSYQVENIQKGDVFWIEGDIQNIGTVSSKNITVIVNDNGIEKPFHFAKIEPNQIETWNISSNASSLGEYNLEIELWSEDPFEIDPENNYTSFSFMIFDKIGHEYLVNTENKNILEIETNEKGEYEFPWLESYVIINNLEPQSWDYISINATLTDNWTFESEGFLHISQETSALVRIKPPLNTETGEYKINLKLIDRNGLQAGYGIVTVNVPQYYGVGIKADNSGDEISIVVQNNGNGKDSFKLEKSLDEGLTLYLTETYFELEAFEEIRIKGIGIQGNESKNYVAQFVVNSIGNQNISAEISLIIDNINQDEIEDRKTISIILAGVGILGIMYIVYQRRVE
ncbi:MAG: hypothetical protein BEU04_03895 [Marine Group III euryarchaeote CG-Bathy1]|uniref:Uncharacterized protein n=1 Tax=Marine Group III euryarchaeote CG-Bathy1 TaxID=1889001 RepID=A0A1J5TJ49_9ARCH|nr:MAG: hypothetical protein BEU04_03895 [Marine Group III euryarchaeote CG-Bathy1]